MTKKINLFFSEPHIEIPKDYAQISSEGLSRNNKYPLLGELLQEAGLLTEKQIQVALQEQNKGLDLRIGEILELHGWISSKTAQFFAQQWFNLLDIPSSHPIGYYFQQAALLSEKQINRILREQKRMNFRFGEIAILDGFLPEKTVKFFVNHLQATKVAEARNKKKSKNIVQQEEYKTKKNSVKSGAIIDIPWID